MGGEYKIITLEEGQNILPINWSSKPKWYFGMYQHFGESCALSGETLNTTIDHVLPRQPYKRRSSKGNLLPIAHHLNSSKNNKNLFEWFYGNKDRFDLCEIKFIKALTYLAEQNDMSVWEYYSYYEIEYANYLDYLKSKEAED